MSLGWVEISSRVEFSENWSKKGSKSKVFRKRFRKGGFAVALVSVGITENRADGDHAAEINDYIRNHNLVHDECIVIDDDAKLFHSKLEENCKLILTDARIGFHVRK